MIKNVDFNGRKFIYELIKCSDPRYTQLKISDGDIIGDLESCNLSTILSKNKKTCCNVSWGYPTSGCIISPSSWNMNFTISDAMHLAGCYAWHPVYYKLINQCPRRLPLNKLFSQRLPLP